MKQARYFPGQNITNTQTHQPGRNPAYARVSSNALGGSTYIPSFGGGTQSKGVPVGGGWYRSNNYYNFNVLFHTIYYAKNTS